MIASRFYIVKAGYVILIDIRGCISGVPNHMRKGSWNNILLKMQGKADEYTFTGSGKLVRKNCIGPPDKPPNADSNIDPELVNLIQSIIFQHK